MRLFRKKKRETKGCCSPNYNADAMIRAEALKTAAGIKVLGSGCEKCGKLKEAVLAALAELGMDISIEHITDFTRIAAYGVMTTPALVVDGKVVSYGKVLTKEEVMALLRNSFM